MTKEQIEVLRKTVNIFIDFEASGLHPDSYPIEIGIVHDNTKYQKYIKPVYHWTYWCYNAQDIHNIKRETLINEGFDVVNIATELNSLFSGKTLWANANADKFWMDSLFEESGIEREFNISNILNVLPEEYHSLLEKEMSSMNEHRALADAMELQRAWQSFLNKIEKDSL